MIKEGEELFYACRDETVCTKVSGGNEAFLKESQYWRQES